MHPWTEPHLEALRRRLESLPHAILLHGPKGIGKRALADTIAQLILCESADPGRRPCGTCEGCRWFAAGNHPDFRRVEPESLLPQATGEPDEDAPAEPARKGKPSQEIKVGQVRELADFLNVGSHRGRRRVALVHPAEDMNANSANALLKGLEEPPGGAMFILVSHRPARLLPTIRSRCVAVSVGVPDRESALGWLAAEGVKDAARWLAYAGGAPLRAREYAENAAVLDRLLATVQGRADALPDSREELEALAEALQKLAIDGALTAAGLPSKYGTTSGPGQRDLLTWLRFARRMGHHRGLARHPLNPRLFGAQMLGEKP
ncbi:MAG TPA: DNA polymerase III subunit delta' [Burkholderiales bacterium]|nr:DNA polymerase III subunit delta' [Burkholderiales bacterium]